MPDSIDTTPVEGRQADPALVREIAVLGGDVHEFVHPTVEAELKKHRRV